MNLQTIRAAALLFLTLLCVSVSPAFADEEILSFESTVIVREDGTLSVDEVIRVRAEGRSIRRGIFRDFPVRSKTKHGFWNYVGFELTGVLKDDRNEPHFMEQHGNFVRIYIGEPSVYLRPGEYTYTIKYETTRQLRHFDDLDELYWNVTGNFWSFPIRKVIARIVLPDGAHMSRKAAYTGQHGAQGKDFQIVHEANNSIVFTTTRTLNSREGLTVAAGWQKGIVAQLSITSVIFRFLWNNFGFFLLLTGVFALGRYFYRTWWKVGRNPPKGTIIPLFKPPVNLSPAAVSYIHYQGFEHAGKGATKPFIAALISLAVKGYMNLSETGDDLILKNTKQGSSKLGSGEKSIFSRLLEERSEFEVTKKNGKKLKSAQNVFNSTILHEYEGVFFKHNLGFFVAGLVVSFALLIGSFVFQQPDETTFGMLVVSLLSAVVGTFVFFQGLRRLNGWVPGGGSQILGFIFAILGVVILLPTLLAPFNAGNLATALMAAATGILGAMNVLFFFLVRAPTPGGRQVMDEIEGFHMYLATAEAERMNMAGAPEMSRQLFERYLPFAIALGVEKPWSDAFSAHLARSAPDERSSTSYQPRWYSGSHWDADRLGRTTSNMVSSMSASMQSAMPAPKSSSGSGGGGFSGGGGGGGGGGGW
ncbi:MAG: DUF2207 domain-containing protein [Hyphomicrobiales bacterium]